MRETTHPEKKMAAMDSSDTNFPAKSGKTSDCELSDEGDSKNSNNFDNSNNEDSDSNNNNHVGHKRSRGDLVLNLHAGDENYAAVDLSRKGGKFSRERNGPKFKSNSAQSNIMKLSPIKIQIPHLKDLGTKIKNKKEPLPMKLRALPRSFWLQPNQPTPFSPAPALPPLANISSTRYEENQASQNPASSSGAGHSSVTSDANTELLFSLFNGVENGKRPSQQKRGRPKKLQTTPGVGPRDDDPCLVPAGLLPSLDPSRPKPDNPKPLNYSQLLNELVIQL